MGETTHRLTAAERSSWAHVGVLAALALVLGYLETFIPMPMPGIKLGLANIAILVAIADVGAGGAFFVLAIKVLATGLLFGNPLMIVYSAVGSLLAFAGMVPLSRLKTMHIAMTSVVGGMLHEIGQLFVASVLLGTTLVWYSAPVLLIAGCLTGALCGIISSWVIRMLERGVGDAHKADAALLSQDDAQAARHAGPFGAPKADAAKEEARGSSHTGLLLVLLVVFAVVVLHLSSPLALLVALAVAAVACVAGGARPRLLAKALVPMLFFVLFAAVMQALSNRSGAVLLQVGPLVVTSGCVEETLRMLARLLAVVLANVAFMSSVPTGDLTATVERLLGPFARLGLRTEGPILSFGIAMRFVPILADSLVTCFSERGSRGLSRKFWQEEVPARIVVAYAMAEDAAALVDAGATGELPDNDEKPEGPTSPRDTEEG